MAAPISDALYSIFQHVYDSFGPISRDVIRNINLVGVLDKKVQDVNEKINEKVNNYVVVEGESPLIDVIEGLHNKMKGLEAEKAEIIDICIDMLTNYSEKIDQAVSSIVAKPSIPSTRSSTPIQTPIPKKRKYQAQARQHESPQQQQSTEYISPDELIYCYCRKVSYGSMIACDNPSCPYEWFHFGCVGMTEIPEGSWFCPRCSRKKRKKA